MSVQLNASTKPKKCSRCGDSFACGAASGSCWCFAFPKVITVPSDGASGCLCPRCLEAAVSKQRLGEPKNGVIERLPAAEYAYLRNVGPYGPALTAFWQKFISWSTSHGLCSDSAVWFGISHDSPMTTPPEECRYDACVEIRTGLLIERDAAVGSMPGGVYLVVPFRGTASEIGAAFSKAMHDTVPHTGYEFDLTRPIFERYRGAMNSDIGTFSCELCIPLR